MLLLLETNSVKLWSYHYIFIKQQEVEILIVKVLKGYLIPNNVILKIEGRRVSQFMMAIED